MFTNFFSLTLKLHFFFYKQNVFIKTMFSPTTKNITKTISGKKKFSLTFFLPVPFFQQQQKLSPKKMSPKKNCSLKNSNSNCDQTPKLKLWQNSKTQIFTKLKNSNSDKTQKLNLCHNANTQIVTKLKI